MWSKFKALSAGRKVLVGVAAFVAIGIAGAAASPPQPTPITPTAPPKVQSDKINVKTVTQTQPVPFQTTTQNDSTLASGTIKVTTTGVNGVETITYKVTYTNGVETNREKVSDVITAQPITQVTKIGTYVAPKPNCDPNYTGCVPNVYPADVDCAGGSGNGPYYVQGPVRVIGVDRYGLDRDGDGIACE
jgi:hypothetical protein